MTIPDLKAALTMAQVLHHYHLKPDKKLRLSCPFHEDKTPSMQVYYKTHTAYCFSGNCPTHGKSLDVIDFVMHKEGCSKHEAIERCKAMIGGASGKSVPQEYQPVPITDLPAAAVLERAFTYYCNAVAMTRAAQDYLESRGLDYKLLAAAGLAVGYNSGQMHHGARRDEDLIASLVAAGLLSESVSGRKSREGLQQYHSFGHKCLAFALRGAAGEIAGLYFRSVATGGDGAKAGRHYYLRDRRGLYPGYPAPDTERVLVTESVVDAVSLLQYESVAKRPNGVGGPAGEWSVLAMYGTNGYTAEHAAALAALAQLSEVCLFLNGDAAGRKAAEIVAAKVRAAHPTITVSSVPVPEGEDCNSLLVAQGPELLAHLIEERVTLAGGTGEATEGMEVFSSTETTTEDTTENGQDVAAEGPEPRNVAETTDVAHRNETVKPQLDTADAYDLGYRGRAASLRVKGLRADQLDTLKVTLQIQLA